MTPDTFAAKFRDSVSSAEADAAKIATETSQAAFIGKLSPRPLAPARDGRPTTSGSFPTLLRWQRDGKGGIILDEAVLLGKAPYAFIQEIGTGQSARILNPPGEISVASQVGRRIPMSLAWANDAGGPPYRAMSGMGTQQLFPLDGMMDANGEQFHKQRSGRIRRQIKGKHFLRDGGAAGFEALRAQMMRDAKRFLS